MGTVSCVLQVNPQQDGMAKRPHRFSLAAKSEPTEWEMKRPSLFRWLTPPRKARIVKG
jgi:hypothetical protein